jgi:hypothetical protein
LGFLHGDFAGVPSVEGFGNASETLWAQSAEGAQAGEEAGEAAGQADGVIHRNDLRPAG